MDTPTLRRFIEPLLTAGHLVPVRFRTAALARWPYRFTAGPDADELLRLFEQVCAGGKSLALIADLSHPRELEPEPAGQAARRIRGTGAVIYAGGTLADMVNEAPGVWAALWRAQVRLGMIPGTMALVPVYRPGNASPGDAGPGAADLRRCLRQRLRPGPVRSADLRCGMSAA